MGIIVTIKCAKGNVFLQLSGKTDAAKWLPLLLVKLEIAEKMLLADVRGGVSLVVSESELPVLLNGFPENVKPEIQKVGLVEITGYGLRTDTKALSALYEVLEYAGIAVVALSVSDTDLTIAVPENREADCLHILPNHFGDRIE